MKTVLLIVPITLFTLVAMSQTNKYSFEQIYDAGNYPTLNFSSEDGDINATDITGNVETGSADGDVNLKNIAGNTRMKTIDGNIRFYDLKGNIHCATTDGDIDGELTGLKAPVECAAADGDIKLRLK